MQKYKISNGILNIFFDSRKVKAGFVTNQFGDPGFKNDKFKREKILNDIFSQINLNYFDAVFQNQMHTNNVKIVGVNDRNGGKIEKQDAIQDNDGLITNERRVILTAWGADCSSVFLYDEKKEIIALLHSGREGTRKNIVNSAIKKMKEKFKSIPSDIIAVIGPGICKNCYQINEEIAKNFEPKFLNIIQNGVFLDLKAKIYNQLIIEGVKRIYDVNICTKCDKRFYSYRREGKSHGSGLAFMVLI